jgi:hypothetical protein
LGNFAQDQEDGLNSSNEIRLYEIRYRTIIKIFQNEVSRDFD